MIDKTTGSVTDTLQQINRTVGNDPAVLLLTVLSRNEVYRKMIRPKQKWAEQVVGGDGRIAEKFGIDRVTARVLLNRGLKEEEEIASFLHGTLEQLEDPRRMDQIADAAGILHDCIVHHKKIRIIGDYDADGIFSTYILYHSLEKAGACVSYEIPDRITDGFGMSMRLVEHAHQDGMEVIITCDNGIAQNAEISRAKQLGMTVIVTDHHEPNYENTPDGEKKYLLPDADVIVDPKKPGCPYPNKNLCGAGVAWKLMYLYECLSRNGFSGDALIPVQECPLAMENLPFAAAATVTDIMRLSGENRILVKAGLKMLPETDNTGMRALITSCGLDGKRIRTGHVGFIIGPCMNASGRIDTAGRAVRLLLESDPEKALAQAKVLVDLNDKRKKMTEEGKDAAFDLIEHTSLADDKVLVIYLKGIHESVAGIIASKVKETLHRPVLIFTDTENPDHLKGSGRSIEAYNMHEELSRVSGLFIKFGGHPMAAGVTIPRRNLDKLRTELNETCRLTPEDLTEKILLDAVLPFSYLTEERIMELDALEPFGPGMRSPLFGCSRVRVLRLNILGENRNCARMLVDDGTRKTTALYFGDADALLLALKEQFGEDELTKLLNGKECGIRLTLAYRPGINEYRGERSIQLQIAHFR